MKWTRQFIKWLLLLLLGVIILFLLNIAWHRLRGPTADEQAALELVEVPYVAPQGRNAFATLWLFAKDVPDTDFERLAARDVEYVRSNLSLTGEELQFPSNELPDLDVPDARSTALCEDTPESCLATVRENPESTREALARHDRLLQRAVAIEDHEYLHNDFPPVLSMAVTTTVHSRLPQRLRTSQLALMFVDGMHEQALAGVCRNLSTWRRFGRDNRSLVQTMLAASRRDADIALLADMLAEMDAAKPLPADCDAALVPVVAGEVSLCSAMIGEFAYIDDLLDPLVSTGKDSAQKGWLERNTQPLVFDASRVRAWRARETEAYCKAEDATQALEDRLPVRPPLEIDWFDCQANKVGCILTRIGAPEFNEYHERLLDSAAHLRLAATLVWLRETEGNGQSLQQRFDARPDHLRTGSRPTGISEDGRSIWVENLYTRRSARFSLPLATKTEYTP
ncbi:hypothetical protein [Dokdonella sp.]|uniref:hypothetical protein n=1 Tax=Dokdonella sp. TaxID=2291710 RepID=UPI003529586D